MSAALKERSKRDHTLRESVAFEKERIQAKANIKIWDIFRLLKGEQDSIVNEDTCTNTAQMRMEVWKSQRLRRGR